MKNMHRKKLHEDAWENRELGAAAKFVRKVSAKKEKSIEDSLGLQLISIRLQKSLIASLREFAQEDGIGYQPYIRRLLTQHVRSEKKNRLVRWK